MRCRTKSEIDSGQTTPDGEPIYLCRAIKSRVFHRTFLSLGLGQQLR
jgi:hypothetical protein